MKLRILSIHEQGDATKEYVWLEVLEDCNVHFYAIADTTYTDPGKISNRLRHVFWLPSAQVKKGERVVVMTRPGKNDTYTTSAGTKVHRFYWGLNSAVWNNTGDAAVLFEIATWKTTTA